MQLDTETIESLFNNINATNRLIYTLIGALILNIAAVILRFYLDIKLKDREQFVYKRNLITSKGIELKEQIFQRIEKLSLFSKGEEELLLKELQDLQQLISSKQLYLEKGILNVINNIMDYYKVILISYKQKDFKREQKYLDEYIKSFYK